jgi:hypothetical protein
VFISLSRLHMSTILADLWSKVLDEPKGPWRHGLLSLTARSMTPLLGVVHQRLGFRCPSSSNASFHRKAKIVSVSSFHNFARERPPTDVAGCLHFTPRPRSRPFDSVVVPKTDRQATSADAGNALPVLLHISRFFQDYL